MNLYFLVEGRSTEKKVYPKLVEFIFEGQLSPVRQVQQATHNNYFVFTANGYPRIFTDVLKNTIEDINNYKNYSHLFLCIDADESSIAEREEELNSYLEQFEQEGVVLDASCQLHLIIQNRCIETWFLGNRKVYKSNPANPRLVEYQAFYNVKQDDPELMTFMPPFDLHAPFHVDYLRAMLAERNVRYSKNHPRDVTEPHYIKELVARAESTGAIASFYHFYNLCQTIKNR